MERKPTDTARGMISRSLDLEFGTTAVSEKEERKRLESGVWFQETLQNWIASSPEKGRRRNRTRPLDLRATDTGADIIIPFVSHRTRSKVILTITEVVSSYNRNKDYV